MSRIRQRIAKLLPVLILSTFTAAGQAQVTVVNMIPNSRSGETQQDSEPNLAVNPANPQQIAGSAFTPDPLNGPNAPIYVSLNGGTTWVLNSILPGNSPTTGTGDLTLRFGGTSNNLYAGDLRGGAGLRLNILRTANFAAPGLMTVLVDRNNVDQPYVQATTVLGGPTASMSATMTSAPPAAGQRRSTSPWTACWRPRRRPPTSSPAGSRRGAPPDRTAHRSDRSFTPTARSTRSSTAGAPSTAPWPPPTSWWYATTTGPRARPSSRPWSTPATSSPAAV